MTEINLTNPNAPATKRQLWALFVGTKKDHREMNLTKLEAFNLIQEMNKANGFVNDEPPKINQPLDVELLKYLQDNSEKIAERFNTELGLESIVGDSPLTKKPDPKSYKFFGSGMGFSHIKYDKRSKKAGVILEAFGKIRENFDEWFIDKYFTKEKQQEFIDIGFPLHAMMIQNLSINSGINSIVVKFMESKGCKNISINNMLD